MFVEIHTDDSQEYQFHAAPVNTLKFKVKAGHDAHVALSSSDDQEASPIYEIFIGGWNNAKSAIRRDRNKPDRARGFWVNWDAEGKVEVGREGESEPFLSYNDPEPFTITHYGLRTAWGASGEWEVEGGAPLSTSNDNKYNFRPTCQGRLLFSVRAGHNAHVALTSGPRDTERMYEVFIGGWDNSKSAIRKNKTKPDDGYRGFELSWQGGLITLKDSASGATILQWQDQETIPVTHYGIRTAWGSQGDWKIGQGMKSVKTVAPAPLRKPRHADEPETPGEAVWIAVSNGEIPEGAVAGGTDHDCELIVARAQHEGALLPGKLVLCGVKPTWVQVNQGDEIPHNALPGGRTTDGETLFIGRVPHEGTVTIGKVHPSHASCYIPYGGEEVGFPEYEVLVRE
ncbi:hypothetical protein B566_EDAN007278 [Ephemera danica]|nr:hypothetical protein B566_EDAN007278 [Ephemera danica]